MEPERLKLTPRTLASLAMILMPCLTQVLQAKETEHPGAVIYKKLCVECHGEQGEGVTGKTDEPLYGERTLEALAKRIGKTMPEDDPGSVEDQDARKVAAYIYDAFYSPAAQAKLHPPEKDLSRLTIEQYRNSVADLLGRFRQGFDRPPGPERGLKGRYSGAEIAKAGEQPKPDGKPKKKDQEPKKKNVKFDRVDGRIDFHFGQASPDPEKMDADEFTTRWEGSIIAEDTGTYEFIIKTENGARLWVNDSSPDRALIDAWVSSGPDVREEKKCLFLIGGRTYSLMLEHFKFKEKSASIQLLWKTPHGVLEIIPQRYLVPQQQREIMVVDTSFPADDRSVGYERGTGVSKAWDQATTEAAIKVTEHVELYLDRLAETKAGAPDREAKLRQFCQTFVETAFRRPLSDDQRQRYVEHQFQAAKTPELAVKRVVLFTLKSPQFLYPDLHERDQPDDYDVASRLALDLWDSLPDKQLRQAATEGKLRTRDQISAQARRMVTDPRTKAKLHGFFHHWLELDRAEAIAKDQKVFPGFNDVVLADLRTSLNLFLDEVVWSPQSDYRELLKADYLMLNQRLAKFYGKGEGSDEFQRVSFDPKERAGIITHPYLLAAFAYSKQTSPIHRGVFLTRNIVGMSLKDPPMAVAFKDSHFNPKLTMREKITEMTRGASCQGCHSVINPLGFSLENFDAIGRWRLQDNNKPVNTISEFATDDGKTLHITGPRDIVDYAAGTPGGHRAFIRHLFHHTVKQDMPAYGHNTQENLRRSFTESGFNIQKLLTEIAIVAAMDGMTPTLSATTTAPPSPTAKP